MYVHQIIYVYIHIYITIFQSQGTQSSHPDEILNVAVANCAFHQACGFVVNSQGKQFFEQGFARPVACTTKGGLQLVSMQGQQSCP